MPTRRLDPTFQPGCYVFGFTLPGQGPFGNARTYPQQAIFGARAFGGEVAGKNTETDVLKFIYGATFNKPRHRCPKTPFMCVRASGDWAKRAVHYVRQSRPMVRIYRPYDGAAKEHLVPWQLKFSEAQVVWAQLDSAAKARVCADAQALGITYQGKDWFTKLYIQNDARWSTYV